LKGGRGSQKEKDTYYPSEGKRRKAGKLEVSNFRGKKMGEKPRKVLPPMLSQTGFLREGWKQISKMVKSHAYTQGVKNSISLSSISITKGKEIKPNIY